VVGPQRHRELLITRAFNQPNEARVHESWRNCTTKNQVAEGNDFRVTSVALRVDVNTFHLLLLRNIKTHLLGRLVVILHPSNPPEKNIHTLHRNVQPPS
jgi:hypothetical protein